MSKKDYFSHIHLLEKSIQYAYKNCIPIVTTIELTHSCNFSCVHCYNFDRTTLNSSPQKDILTKDEVLTIIKDLEKLGSLFINFSGGEALLDPHIEEYVKFTRSLHMEPRLKSNGSLLTFEKAQKLKDAGLGGIDISIYGSDKETYIEFSGVDQFESSIKGIKNAKDVGLDVHVSLILHRHNVEKIDELVKICHDLQVPFQFSTEVTGRYDGSKSSTDHDISPSQYEELLQGPYKDNFIEICEPGSYQCSCARSVCGISCTGIVYPCIGAPVPSGNIREKSLIDIWKNSPTLNRIRNLKTSDFKECVNCEVQEHCSRSSGSVYINTGNYTGCEPKALEQARIQAKLVNK